MIDFSVHLLAMRIFVSCIGLVGNVSLVLFIFQNKLSRIKTYEMFLIGLAASNLEEIISINVYDLLIYQSSTINQWSCRFLKFLTVFGEITSILFTVLISIYRYQKLRDATTRVNLSIYMDSIRSASMLSGICITLSVIVSLPIFVVDLQEASGNVTRNSSSSCPPDFFHCSKNDCPLLNRLYKYLFIIVCHLVPLIIVTVTGCLILKVLLAPRKVVTPVNSVSGLNQLNKLSKSPRLQRSTAAVLAAMGLFQIDWTLYSVLQLSFSPSDAPVWAEVEFFISTSYTSISPYVYGVGSNLFTFKKLNKK